MREVDRERGRGGGEFGRGRPLCYQHKRREWENRYVILCMDTVIDRSRSGVESGRNWDEVWNCGKRGDAEWRLLNHLAT